MIERQERIRRINRMEDICDRGITVVEGLISEIQRFQAMEQELRELEEYYMGPQWLADREAERRGEVPGDLKRGILAEDTIYDLLTDIHRMKGTLREVIREE